MDYKVGRELDALVAEKVMGFEMKDGETVQRWEKVPGVYTGHTPKPYSTDIAAAWEVVEKLRQNDVFKRVCIEESQTGWKAGITDTEPGQGTYFTEISANCETAPHAICLAALKAIGDQTSPS